MTKSELSEANKPEDEAVATAPASKPAKRQRRFVLMIVAVALMVAGGIRIADYFETTQLPPELPQPDSVVTEDAETPSEVKVDTSTYTVPADMPRRILIEKLSVDGIIQQVGLNPDSAISTPSNVWYAGWFNESSKPGEVGLSIIDGHVSGRYSDGIFKQLKILAAGDKVQVEYGDMSLRTFEVVEVKSLPVDEAAEYLLKHRKELKSQLNLITCGGNFDAETELYAERVIVVTKKVGEG